jgi:hypothetical protein
MTSNTKAAIWVVAIFGSYILLLWLFPQQGHSPRTGRNCVEVVNRLSEEINHRFLTKEEEMDLDDCGP